MPILQIEAVLSDLFAALRNWARLPIWRMCGGRGWTIALVWRATNPKRPNVN